MLIEMNAVAFQYGITVSSNMKQCKRLRAKNAKSRAAPGTGNLQRTVTPDLAVAH